MVVGSHHCFPVTAGCPSYIGRQQCGCTFYLFAFLMKWLPRHTSLTVIITGFSLLFVYFRSEWILLPVVIASGGFISGRFGEWVHLTWMKLARALGWINSRILLGVVFYALLTPIALIARLLGKTSIRKKADAATSQFTIRNHLYNQNDLEHPW